MSIEVGHKFLGIKKIRRFDPGFVSFDEFYSTRRSEFPDADAAWLLWYLNENRVPGDSPAVLDVYPDGYLPQPGTFVPPGHPDHITKEQIASLEPELSESELREAWFMTNMFSGSNEHEITFLISILDGSGS